MGSVGFDPGFVEGNEAVRVEADVPERVEFFAGGDDIGPLLLGGDERFFERDLQSAQGVPDGGQVAGDAQRGAQAIEREARVRGHGLARRSASWRR